MQPFISGFRTLSSSFKKRPWLSLGQIVAGLLVFLGFFLTVSFVSAITPHEAALTGDAVMPTHWEAGIMNHGEYYRWYTISNHPILFGISLAVFVGSAGFILLSGTIVTWLEERNKK